VKWRRLFVAFTIAAGSGVLVTVMVRAQVSIADLFQSIPPTAHLLALAATATTLAGRAVRSRILAHALGERLGVGTAIRAQLVADAAGSVTPARLGSEAGKLLILHRAGIGVVSGAAINVAEVVCEAATLTCMVAVLLLVLPIGEALPAVGALSYAVAIAATSGGSLLLANLPGERPPRLWSRLSISADRWRQVHGAGQGFLARARLLSRIRIGSVLPLVLVSATNLVARLAILPALTGVPDDVGLWPLVVWPALLLYGGAIVPVPGGGGTVELGFLAGLGSSLSPIVLATTLVWWRVYTHYLSAGLGGLLLLAGAHRHSGAP